MKTIFTGLLFFVLLSVQAQNSYLQIIHSVTKEPIAGAQIRVKDKIIGISDTNGRLQANSIPKQQEWQIIAMGFQSKAFPNNVSLSIIELDEENKQLDQVVVTASKQVSSRVETPVAIHKINAQLIQDTKALLLTELINKVPGVVMLNYNNEQHGMGIRQPFGTSAYFLYLEDGLPLRPLGVFNHNALIETNIQGLNSIEVIKGPASSLYGPEAVGGAINLITKRASGIPTFQVGYQMDQWGYQRTQFTAGAILSPKWSIMTGGYISRQRNSWASNSDFNKTSINVRLDYKLSKKTNLWGSFAYNDYYSQTGGNIDSTGFYSRTYQSPAGFTYRSSFSSRSRLTLEHQWNEKNATDVTLYYRDNALGQNPAYSISWTSPNTTATGQVNLNSFSSFGLMAQHKTQVDFLHSKILTGILLDRSPNDYWAYKVNLTASLRPDKKSVEKYTIKEYLPNSFLSNYSAIIWNKAVYAQWDMNPLEKLRFSIGGRFDQMSFDYTNFIDNSSGTKSYEKFSPKLGITYEIAQNIGVYGNYSKGFSPPALSAVFRARPASQVVTTGEKFYLSINPATFNNYEIGGWTSLFKHKLYIDLTAYRLEGFNELLNIKQPDNTTDYVSAGQTLHQGIEYAITYKPSSQFSFRFSGTNAKHTFESFILSTKASDVLKNVNGKEMPQAPHFVGNMEITYKPTWLAGSRIAFEWQRIGSWYVNQVNTVQYADQGFLGAKGVSVLNIRMGYQYKAFQFFANILNASNELYATAASRGNNATDKTTFTPAAPRNINAGVMIDIFQIKNVWKN